MGEFLSDSPALTVHTQVFGNGHGQLLPDSGTHPGAIVISVGEDWQTSLPVLIESLPASRPPVLVVCPVADIELMKAAMRAGARDVVNPPYDIDDLSTTLVDLAQESYRDRSHEPAHLFAVINAKGGSGASFLAANIATDLARSSERAIKPKKTILMDFDIQFASLPSYLNMSAKNGLIRALEVAETLDIASIEGFAQKHENGVHLLAADASGLVSPEDISEQRVELLMSVLDESYDNIVVDLPRRLDRFSATVLDRVDKVAVVAQQSVLHLQDARRIVGILREFLGVTSDRVMIVLNRYDKKSDVRLEDFIEGFPGTAVVVVPGDFRRVAESVNLGVPVVESAPTSPLAKAIHQVSMRLETPAGNEKQKAGGLLGWLGLSGNQ